PPATTTRSCPGTDSTPSTTGGPSSPTRCAGSGVARRLKAPPSARHGWLLAGLIVAHVALAVWYSVAVPLWEAPDEPDHYQYAWYIGTRYGLPTEMVGLVASDTDEAHQPPLYYALGGLLVPLLGPEPALLRPNPYFTWGPG